jgi:hypothetical protein
MIKKTYRLTLLLVLTICIQNVNAQNDEAAVKKVINQLFDGMRSTDTAMMRAAFTRQAILQSVGKSREGKTVIETEPLDSFFYFIAKPHKEIYDEQITFDFIKIDGDLATVWTPYKFYIGTKFSHCGVDSYQLVRENGNWKIQYLIDTRRRENCL